MDLFLLVCFISMLIFIRPVGRGCQNDQYLSSDTTTYLSGFMAVGIILHHLSEAVPGGRFFPQLVHLGYLLVSVFFFLSGYGLMVQYRKKGSRYLEGFWKKRVLYIVLVYLWVSVAYAVVKALTGTEMSLRIFFASFVNGSPVATNSWYVIVQVLLYAIFWFVFRFVPGSNHAKIAAVTVMEAVLAVLFSLLSYSSIWYLSNFAFAAGMLWAEEKEPIDLWLKKHWLTGEALSLLVFVFFSGLPLIFSRVGIDFEWISVVCRFLSSTAFTVFLITAMRKIRPVGKIWKKIGEMSFEIYLMHGMVMLLLRKVIENDLLFAVSVIPVSLVVSWAASWIDHKLKKLVSSR